MFLLKKNDKMQIKEKYERKRNIKTSKSPDSVLFAWSDLIGSEPRRTMFNNSRIIGGTWGASSEYKGIDVIFMRMRSLISR